eukprot:12404465-Karenia_brevis.AAC.1
MKISDAKTKIFDPNIKILDSQHQDFGSHHHDNHDENDDDDDDDGDDTENLNVGDRNHHLDVG